MQMRAAAAPCLLQSRPATSGRRAGWAVGHAERGVGRQAQRRERARWEQGGKEQEGQVGAGGMMERGRKQAGGNDGGWSRQGRGSREGRGSKPCPTVSLLSTFAQTRGHTK